jgi:cytochrome c peroxidase
MSYCASTIVFPTTGTYSIEDNTGGSNGCTMRFEAESSDPENAGIRSVISN